jgi:hypothetical protein
LALELAEYNEYMLHSIVYYNAVVVA